jgi:hypothetical protein
MGYAVYARFGTFIPPATVVRGLIAGGVGFSVAKAITRPGAVFTLLALVGGALAYALVLFALRECTGQDFATIKRLTQRKRAGE